MLQLCHRSLQAFHHAHQHGELRLLRCLSCRCCYLRGWEWGGLFILSNHLAGCIAWSPRLFHLEVSLPHLQCFFYTADLGGQPVSLQVRVVHAPEERVVDEALSVTASGVTESSLSQALYLVCVVFQRSPPVPPHRLQMISCFFSCQAEPGSESPHNVCLIRPKSEAPGPACQTGPKLENAHPSWPFSDGGHVLELPDELFHVSSEMRGLEAIPVTR